MRDVIDDSVDIKSSVPVTVSVFFSVLNSLNYLLTFSASVKICFKFDLLKLLPPVHPGADSVKQVAWDMIEEETDDSLNDKPVISVNSSVTTATSSVKNSTKLTPMLKMDPPVLACLVNSSTSLKTGTVTKV